MTGEPHAEGAPAPPEQVTGAAEAVRVGQGTAVASGVLVEKRDAQIGSFEGGTASAGVMAVVTRLISAAVPDLLRAAKVRAFRRLEQ